MRNPRVLCNIHGNSASGLRPRAHACIFHKTLGLMLYISITYVPVCRCCIPYLCDLGGGESGSDETQPPATSRPHRSLLHRYSAQGRKRWVTTLHVHVHDVRTVHIHVMYVQSGNLSNCNMKWLFSAMFNWLIVILIQCIATYVYSQPPFYLHSSNPLQRWRVWPVRT